MVDVKKTIVPVGLYTDPGPFSAAPEGALVEAQNVVIQRDGLLEPRPSLNMSQQTAVTLSPAIIEHSHYLNSSDNFIWYKDALSGSINWQIVRDNSDIITGPDDFSRGEINSLYVDGRLLFTSDDGICEAPLDSGTIAYRAGLPQPIIPLVYAQPLSGSSSKPGWLADGESVGYRIVVGRHREDGTLMLSAPSSMIIVRNDTGYDARVDFEDTGPTGSTHSIYDVGSTFDTLLSTDLVFIYRGPKIASLTSVPSDEMMLRTVAELNSGATFTFNDYLDDEAWSGAALYTNETQQGILQANYRPDYARDISQYNDMTFLAGERPRVRAVVTIDEIGGGAGSFQSKAITGSVTSGSTTISSISAADISYCIAGQIVTRGSGIIGHADSRFPADTYIVSVGTSSVTVSAAALSTAAATSLRTWDWLSIEDSTTGNIVRMAPTHFDSAYYSYTEYESIFLQENGGSTLTEYYQGGYQDLETKFNAHSDRPSNLIMHAVGSNQLTGITLSFEKVDWDDGEITIKSTRPLIITSNQGGGIDYTTGLSFGADSSKPGRLRISKQKIPDAYPLLNYLDIANPSIAIVRILAAQNTLLVFKEDGLYQITGTDPSNLSVQQLDQSVVPVDSDLAGRWFTKFGSTVFMMSKLGPMAVSDNGATPIGGPIMETLLELFGQFFQDTIANHLLACGSCPVMPYVLFSYYNDITEDYNTFVFNTDNGTWTTWKSRRPFVAYWLDRYNRLGVGIGSETIDPLTGYFEPLRQYIGETDYSVSANYFASDYVSNNSFTSTPSSLGGGWYQMSESEDVVIPEVGDSVRRNATTDWGIIEELIDADTFNVSVYDGSMLTSSGAFYTREGFPIRVIFAPIVLGEIGVEKLFKKLSYAFNQRSLLLRLYAEFESYRLNEDKEQISESIKISEGWTQGLSTADKDKTLAWTPSYTSLEIPISVANDWALKVGFSIQQAHAWFSLGAIVLEADIGDAEINRGNS